MVDHGALLSLRPHLYLRLSLRGLAFGLVWVALLCASMMVWLEVGRTLRNPKPVELTQTTKPTAVAWGDRVFAERSGLAQWLKDHGLRYSGWARRHPAAATIVDPHAAAAPKVARRPVAPRRVAPRKVAPRTAAPRHVAPREVAPRKVPPVARTAAPRSAVSPASGSGAVLKIAFIALLLLLIGFAVLPSRVGRFSRRLPLRPRPEHRFYAATAALAILAGVLVGSMIN
jgi:hypothetical protein